MSVLAQRHRDQLAGIYGDSRDEIGRRPMNPHGVLVRKIKSAYLHIYGDSRDEIDLRSKSMNPRLVACVRK